MPVEGKFVDLGGDDDFAANTMGNTVLAAELHHGRSSGNAQPGLHRAGLVVHAGVNYPAVVTALVTGNAIFFLNQQQAEPGKASRDLERHSESYHTAADNDYVVAGISHSTGERSIAGSAHHSSCNVLVYDEKHLYALADVGHSSLGSPRHRNVVDDRLVPCRRRCRPSSSTTNAATRNQNHH